MPSTSDHHPPTTLDRWFRARVLARLASLERGELELVEAQGTSRLGRPDAERPTGAAIPRIEVKAARFHRRVALGGDLGAAEAWMDGDWTSPDLTSVIRYFIRNLATVDRLDRGAARLRHWGARLVHRFRRNTIGGSRRNIGAHYDLGNDFYRTFLDPTMAYSAGIFESERSSLEEASVAKFDRICRKLDLKPSDQVVEIGTGWGGWAIHAARHYGCRVTTTTISAEQHAHAVAWVRREGLQDRITVLDRDYRRLEGRFDKLVSIEMIEAVGHRYLPEFFRVCRRLLRDDGMAVLQAILIRDDRHEHHLRSSDFIRNYIFPGGDLPSLSSILEATARETDLRLVHFEELSDHYAETLRRWCLAFREQTERVVELGFDERFRRMWHYYLCYCEAAFAERQVNSVQLTFGASGYRGRSLESLGALVAPNGAGRSGAGAFDDRAHAGATRPLPFGSTTSDVTEAPASVCRETASRPECIA